MAEQFGGELLEGRPEPSLLSRRWAALSPRGRRLVAAAAVLAVLCAAAVWLWHEAAERALRQRVALTASIAVVSSSASPPGGAVHWFLSVRNEGARPVSVITVGGGSSRLRLGPADAAEPTIGPGRAVDVPVSVRLTCAPGQQPGSLVAEVGVRREDGDQVRRRIEVREARLVEDVADTLCAVRPALRDHELSGPVLAAPGG